jgi:hypothetical protein
MPDQEFEEYSLENTLKILLKRYPKSNIYIIRYYINTIILDEAKNL